ncbi:putrescine hydroxycinnamoyltransferase 1-like [Miscanthus floridulus]|uniref:putrescine hydroxycinnamoyltransferase 1-like n=1 Tax=Miscanthus floridulus TaxID=154761 RepID=UPI00345ACA68
MSGWRREAGLATRCWANAGNVWPVEGAVGLGQSSRRREVGQEVGRWGRGTEQWGPHASGGNMAREDNGCERGALGGVLQVWWVCLGTAIHHTVCDGRPAGDFMKMWAAIARGDNEATTSLQPCLDRMLLHGRSLPVVRFQHPKYPRRGSIPSTTMKAPFNTAVLPITKNQVEALKGAVGASASKVSTCSVVMAHVWQCSCKAKSISGTADSRIYGVGCLRSRMCPSLLGVYFSNAIALTSTTVTEVKDIVSSPLNAVPTRSPPQLLR